MKSMNKAIGRISIRVAPLSFLTLLMVFISCNKEEDIAKLSAPTVSTTSPSEITYSTATVGGNVTSDGGASIDIRGLCWSTTNNPTKDLATKTENGSGTGAFTGNLVDLTPATTYFVRAYAVNSAGTSYGNEVSITTVALAGPTVSTATATGVTGSAVTIGGNVLNDGGASVSARGVCWSISPNPTADLSTKTIDGSGNGTFISLVNDLAHSTTYYFRAYATNTQGISYGNEVIISTWSPPTVITSSVFDITSTLATVSGDIASDGGNTLSSVGICWGTTSAPTIESDSKVTSSNVAGNFSVTIAGLVDGTNYYARAYATNSIGTAYGTAFAFQAAAPTFPALDNAIIAKMSQYSVPGVSIAIIRNDKLVYVNSYGKSDIEANTEASNSDLYRIASVSKPITAIAILKLVQDGLIGLDQTVFGPNGILGNTYGTPPVGSNKELIRVRHLLEHKSGWTNSPNDPMFLNSSIRQSDLISEVLLNRPLTTHPDQWTYYYLNFGYCVLGRVIEKVTNMSYENYVKLNVLEPSGIVGMKIGGSTLAERFPNEVKYYQSEFSPYLWNIQRMDSHGGWIASSTDLARFMASVSRNSYFSDVVQTSYLNELYFGNTSWSHAGSLSGTNTVVNRMNNNFSFVILCNTRIQSNSSLLISDLNNIMTAQINARSTWPGYDLFD